MRRGGQDWATQGTTVLKLEATEPSLTLTKVPHVCQVSIRKLCRKKESSGGPFAHICAYCPGHGCGEVVRIALTLNGLGEFRTRRQRVTVSCIECFGKHGPESCQLLAACSALIPHSLRTETLSEQVFKSV